jgi:DNA polymerase
MIEVVCDFETASACDLRKCGAARYSEDPTTEILCLVFYVGGVASGCGGWWVPGGNEDYLRELVADPTMIFVSHASFEQFIWKNIMVPQYGFPPLPPERWHDTQAVCAWKSLPLSLDAVSRVLRLQTQKDKVGSRLTIGLSKPDKKTGMLDRSPETLARVVEYCKTDVAGELELHKRIGYLSPAERKIWLKDQEINQRGVRLDLDFISAAQSVVDKASVPLLAEFRALTGGLNPGQNAKVIEWCAGNGVELDNLQKGYLTEVLGGDDGGLDDLAGGEPGDEGSGAAELLPPELPVSVRRVLTIRSQLASASVKKLGAMRACVCDNGRAHGLLQYHAAGTGRWGGRILQPQNFPRGSLKVDDKAPSPETVVSAILTGDPEYVEAVLDAPAIECVASALRHALIPDPGKVFLAGDFAGIEMRVVLALAGQHDKTALLATGKDVYLDMANSIYNRDDLTKADIAERTIGKNTVLGCGFQMGYAKFHERYCPKQSYLFAVDVVDAYRTTWAPLVPELWQAMKDAVLYLIAYNRPSDPYGCAFRREGEWMTVTLPSGWQKLWYYAPAMRDRGDEYGMSPSYMAMKNGQWKSVFLYGGILTENIVQALARGLMVEAMFRLEKEGFPIVLTVHDEIVCEVEAGRADVKAFEQIMAEPTKWSRELQIPIAVEAWQGERYRK